jgi:hypothetical protein
VLNEVAVASEAGLRALGFRIGERSGDSWALVLPNARPARRTLRGDRGRITLSEARKRGDVGGAERVLLVAPSASPGVLDAARLGRWDLLLWEAPLALINGVAYEAIGTGVPGDAPRRRDRLGVPAPRTQPAPLPAGLLDRLPDAVLPPAHTGGRPAWTRWAVARVLLLRGGAAVGHLSDVLGVSRQAVSRALTQWGGLVRRDGAGVWAAADDAALLGAWLAAYPGPGGRVEGWWHPLPPLGQARAAALLAQRAGASPLLGGSVAQQVHAPGTVAQRVEVLLRTHVDLRSAGFEAVPLERASLVTRVPGDPTVWATAVPASVAGQPVVVADRLLAGVNFS